LTTISAHALPPPADDGGYRPVKGFESGRSSAIYVTQKIVGTVQIFLGTVS
jgi:hypothetical protein